MKESKKLRRSLIIAALALLAALFSISAATFAWYIYNTAARTTKVEMVAGSSVSLEISSQPDTGFASSAVMDSFEGRLTPVSTDNISRGFQKVILFTSQPVPGTDTERLVATIFGKSVVLPEKEKMDFHKTSLYLRTNAPKLDIYLWDIGFEDSDKQCPISTAMRVGLVAEKANDKGEYRESIFEISQEHDLLAEDNGAKEPDGGHVLDSNQTDGTTVKFSPYPSENFCNYDRNTGAVTLKGNNSRMLCTVYGGQDGGYGEAVKLDVYLWLEGCDEDCSVHIADQTLTNLALSFAGYAGKGA